MWGGAEASRRRPAPTAVKMPTWEQGLLPPPHPEMTVALDGILLNHGWDSRPGQFPVPPLRPTGKIIGH